MPADQVPFNQKGLRKPRAQETKTGSVHMRLKQQGETRDPLSQRLLRQQVSGIAVQLEWLTHGELPSLK